MTPTTKREKRRKRSIYTPRSSRLMRCSECGDERERHVAAKLCIKRGCPGRLEVVE